MRSGAVGVGFRPESDAKRSGHGPEIRGPKLQAAGWDDEPRSIAEQRTFTDGRIVVRGSQTQRQKLLRDTRDFPIAVAEAEPAADGLQQANEYAEILRSKFVCAAKGREIIPALQAGVNWRKRVPGPSAQAVTWRAFSPQDGEWTFHRAIFQGRRPVM